MHQFNRFAIAAAFAAAMSLVSLHAQQGAANAQNPANAPTLRTADGHPDLSGMWGGGGGGGAVKPDEKGNLVQLTRGRPCSKQQADLGNCEPGINFERDSGVTQRMGPEIPMYKPEFWEKVQDYDRNGTKYDPEFHCKPSGVPRMGPPAKIVQTPTELILMYAQGNVFRVIPIDGRPHDPVKSQDTTWYGDAVGKWEGDTMVIDIVGFNDESWIEWPGWFHSNNMHVIEKLTRVGNTLKWEAIVEDPDVLMEPYHVEGRTLRLNPNAKATLTEDLPCEERDSQHMVTHERG